MFRRVLDTWWSGLVQTYSGYSITAWGSFLYGTTLYWAYGLLLGVLELTPVGAAVMHLPERKLQASKHPSAQDYARCAAVVVRNQLLVNLPVSLLLPLAGRVRADPGLPSAWEVVRDVVGFILVEEVGFYYSHRAMHAPGLYRHIHKVHHEFTAPFGLAATYCHPLEQLLSNIGPLVAGPLLLNSHVLTFWAWVTLATINTINSHSGYALPLAPAPLGHDYHHMAFVGNYGVLGILDTLHGTNNGFNAWLMRRAGGSVRRGDCSRAAISRYKSLPDQAARRDAEVVS